MVLTEHPKESHKSGTTTYNLIPKENPPLFQRPKPTYQTTKIHIHLPCNYDEQKTRIKKETKLTDTEPKQRCDQKSIKSPFPSL